MVHSHLFAPKSYSILMLYLFTCTFICLFIHTIMFVANLCEPNATEKCMQDFCAYEIKTQVHKKSWTLS